MKLDLSIDNSSLQTIHQSFCNIASTLLNSYLLVLEGHRFRLTTIEFYYYRETIHPDRTTHALRYQRARERQRLKGEWYLHKQSISKRLTYKGVDLTFGDGESYGGILIKEVEEIGVTTKSYSQSKFIDRVIEILSPRTKEEFVEMIEKERRLKLFYEPNLPKYLVLNHRRKGLKQQDGFFDAPYAFSLRAPSKEPL